MNASLVRPREQQNNIFLEAIDANKYPAGMRKEIDFMQNIKEMVKRKLWINC